MPFVIFFVLEHGSAADAEKVLGGLVLVVVIAKTFAEVINLFAEWTREGALGTVCAVVQHFVNLEAGICLEVQRTRLASPDLPRWAVRLEVADQTAPFCELFVALVALKEGRRLLRCWEVIFFRVVRIAVELERIVVPLHGLNFGSLILNRFVTVWHLGNLGDIDNLKHRFFLDEDMFGVLGAEFGGNVLLDLCREMHELVVPLDARSALFTSTGVVDDVEAQLSSGEGFYKKTFSV